MQVKLSLPWKISTFIHYILTTESANLSGTASPAHMPQISDAKQKEVMPKKQPMSAKANKNAIIPSCHVQVYLEGDYDTMQEIVRQTNDNILEQEVGSRKFTTSGRKRTKALQADGLVQYESATATNPMYSSYWSMANSTTTTNNAQQLTAAIAGGGGGGWTNDKNRLIRKFFRTLQQLRYVDKLISHLEQFRSNPHNYL